MDLIFTKHIPDLIVTGFMGLLWFDVRRSKINKADAQKDMDKKLTGYLTEDRHDLLCANATLTLEQHMTKEIKEMKDEILTAIKNNGNKP